MIRIIVSMLVALLALPAFAQPADSILINGKILTGDAVGSVRQVVAVRQDRILAVGSNAEIQRLAGRATRVIDLQGRTVIPGLVDSPMHAIRAPLSFGTQVNRICAASLEEALQRIREAARRAKPGGWLIVP